MTAQECFAARCPLSTAHYKVLRDHRGRHFRVNVFADGFVDVRFVIVETSEGYSSRYFTPRPNSSDAAIWLAMPPLVARPILNEPMIEDCSSFNSSS